MSEIRPLPSSHNNIPISKSHLQIKAFLAWIFGIVEGELVELLELVWIQDFLVQADQLCFQFINSITP